MEYTYEKRLGYVVDVTADGVQWGKIESVIGVFPDVLDDGRDASFKPLPPSVTSAMSTYDGMVAL